MHEIYPLVNFEDERELAIWVVLLFGFHLFLRKSNLIPDKRQLDADRQFQRKDFRATDDVMVAHIKWAKNRQFGEKLLLPMARNYKTKICPVFWFHYMARRIPAKPTDPAFCYNNKQGQLVPVVYRETLAQMRSWLEQLGYSPKKYSLHSLRRGGATTAFRAGLPHLTIKMLGDWASTCYFRYIDVTLDARMKAYTLFSLQDKEIGTGHPH